MRLSIFDNIIIVDRKKVDAMIEKKLFNYLIACEIYSFFDRIHDYEFQLQCLSFLLTILVLAN
jgi:hypothetical protein